MLNRFFKLISIFLFCCLLVYPIFAFAQENVTGTTVELPNPIETTDITKIVARIVGKVLGLVGVIALVMFIYGGLMWMTSGGKEEQIRKGRETLVWAVAGLALVFFSYSILNFVLRVLLGVEK